MRFRADGLAENLENMYDQAPPKRVGKLDLPEWDGTPSRWKRYRREVHWFVRGTKLDERKHVVARLLPGLSGSAKDTVMLWNAHDFELDEGARCSWNV